MANRFKVNSYGLGDKIRELREERHYSCEALALDLDISRATLWNIENGMVSPKAEIVGKISTLFQVSPNELFGMYEVDTLQEKFEDILEILNTCSKEELAVISNVIAAIVDTNKLKEV